MNVISQALKTLAGQPSAPAQPSAEAPSVVERSRALRSQSQQRERAAKEATAQQRADALREQLKKVEADCAHELAQIDAAANAADRQFAAELVADAHAAFAPLITAWRTAPTRPLAAEIAATSLHLWQREVNECCCGAGQPRVVLALRNEFIAQVATDRPQVLARFAHGAHGPAVEACGAWLKLLKPTLATAEVPAASTAFDTLLHLERTIEAAADSARGRDCEERTRERWALLMQQDEAHLTEHDRSHAEKQREAFKAAYVRPATA